MKISTPFRMALGILALFLILAFLPVGSPQAGQEKCLQDCAFLPAHAVLNVDSSLYFPTATQCGGCHGRDSSGYALVDGDGQDVNMYDDWRAGIMANSAKDPFWRAKVRHEVLANPAHSLDLQDKCTSCHAPMGHYSALFNGFEHYTLDDLLQDTIGLDGVSCGACHQIKDEKLGKIFSGEMIFDTSRVQYGPYEEPFVPPMANFVGFLPVYSEHVLDAGLCASCHSLVTNTVDLQGEYTGTTFVEQATYHEWLNSRYDVEDISCQSCHMPQITDPVVISSNYLFLQGRTPYGLHELVGGNTHMLSIMKEYREQLGINAGPDHQDAVLQATFDLLQKNTLDLQINSFQFDEDTLSVDLLLHNKAGHKFPSGYPARRAFVQLLLMDVNTGDTLFFSGRMNQKFELVQEDPGFEPHYDRIRFEDQVPIYELILGDVAGNVTTLLERADHALKDNRLTPEGFTKGHPVYDTTQIVGNALLDPDFNLYPASGQEGSGTDGLHYRIQIPDYSGEVSGIVNVWYQSIPPRWVEDLFTFSDPLIDTFEMMYNTVVPEPVLVASAELDTVKVDFAAHSGRLASEVGLKVYPNPVGAGNDLFWEMETQIEIKRIEVYSLLGRQIKTFVSPVNRLRLPDQPGVYILKWFTSRGTALKKVIVR